MPVILICLQSCQKETSKDLPDNSNKEIISKVNTWLETQKPAGMPNKSGRVELLKTNLDFSKSRTENSGDNERLIIIPVNPEYMNARKLEKNAVANLVLIENNTGNIRKGNLVFYTPENGENINKVPDNTYYHIFNTAEPECNGKFQFFSVTGRALYELGYKNKSLRSVGLLQSKPDASVNAVMRTNTSCIDWYLVTTYYDYLGNVLATTEQFVGTTCGSVDCNDNVVDEMLCPDPGASGGGSTGYDQEYEFTVSKHTPWWPVFIFPEPSGYAVNSYEILKGKRVASEPFGGHFTGASHGGDACNKPGGVWGATYTDLNYISTVASARIRGTWSFQGNNTIIEGFNSWSFHQIFP